MNNMANMTEKNSILEVGKSGKGRRHLLNHLNGERLTQRQAILAKCYDCQGYNADGMVDCEMPNCPLYPYMLYKGRIIKVDDTLDLENDPLTIVCNLGVEDHQNLPIDSETMLTDTISDLKIEI